MQFSDHAKRSSQMLDFALGTQPSGSPRLPFSQAEANFSDNTVHAKRA